MRYLCDMYTLWCKSNLFSVTLIALARGLSLSDEQIRRTHKLFRRLLGCEFSPEEHHCLALSSVILPVEKLELNRRTTKDEILSLLKEIANLPKAS